MEYIYLKYFQKGADLELNIEYCLHQRLNELFTTSKWSKMDETQMFHVFDDAAIAIIRLLRGDYFHFKQTPLFDTFIQYSNINILTLSNSQSILDDPEIYPIVNH